MKSYFSRFLYNTLSRTGIREVFTSSLSLSDLIGESRSNKVANLSHLDYRVKPDNDSICTGRSMVEMLGVLAIIGVLSVGAIAGYSKAMMKYKLNQHAQAVNMLINNVLQIRGQLQFASNDYTHYDTLLYKMNLLPDGINYISNTSLQDTWFKSRIDVFYNNVKYTFNGSEVQNNFGSISFLFPKASFGADICRNIVIAAKENAADLYQFVTQKCNSDSSCNYYGRAYGDSYCQKNGICIRNLTLNDISELCNICDDQNCNLIVLWHQ